MRLQGSGIQQRDDRLWRADGSIATGGTAQLVLGRSQSRSHLLLQNTSTGPLWFEVGTGAATCSISGGKVTSVAVTNAGLGFSFPPLVRFYGGGNAFGNTSYAGLAQPGAPAPDSVASATTTVEPLGVPARAHCVMTGSAPSMTISSIVLDESDGGGPVGGAGYVIAPFVAILNSDLDPNGVAAPSAGVGILLPPGASPLIWNGTVCPTDPVAVWGATTGQTFACRWME